MGSRTNTVMVHWWGSGADTVMVHWWGSGADTLGGERYGTFIASDSN